MGGINSSLRCWEYFARSDSKILRALELSSQQHCTI
jgi:hypothetical protein